MYKIDIKIQKDRLLVLITITYLKNNVEKLSSKVWRYENRIKIKKQDLLHVNSEEVSIMVEDTFKMNGI